ncbi:DUF202 domain-containing protein [Paenimyroides baculatum]|uniref:DUF202 domain-containing protein n=1 Tax=Paenimyroides baculatum TaxID=2608000 RepID=A0A5M6CP02_9FLAO|nr:DUF202 domain-containing protein [Paenimyroides baculatum]KAA5535712.1 DUF202 domain-containing protein [Paenimyroides baculatum]
MNKDLILREKLALERTVLANQSTFLSFLRTSLYFLIAGISINNLTATEYGNVIEIVFIVISLSVLFTGILNYSKQKKRISTAQKHIGDYKMEYLER